MLGQVLRPKAFSNRLVIDRPDDEPDDAGDDGQLASIQSEQSWGVLKEGRDYCEQYARHAEKRRDRIERDLPFEQLDPLLSEASPPHHLHQRNDEPGPEEPKGGD